MIGETLIISVYGLSPSILPIIAVISTIIDAPATLLNSTGNTVCSMMIARLVENRRIFSADVKVGGTKDSSQAI
jgi:Na+/H+-dicarboxylate symporter